MPGAEKFVNALAMFFIECNPKCTNMKEAAEWLINYYETARDEGHR